MRLLATAARLGLLLACCACVSGIQTAARPTETDFSQIWTLVGPIPTPVRVAYMNGIAHLQLPADRATIDSAVRRAEQAAMEALVQAWHQEHGLLTQGSSPRHMSRLQSQQSSLLVTFPKLHDGLLAINQQSLAQPCTDALRMCTSMLESAGALSELTLNALWMDCWSNFDASCLAPAQQQAKQQVLAIMEHESVYSAAAHEPSSLPSTGARVAEALDLVEQAKALLSAGLELASQDSSTAQQAQEQLAVQQAAALASGGHRSHMIRGHLDDGAAAAGAIRVGLDAGASGADAAAASPAAASASRAFTVLRGAVLRREQQAAEAEQQPAGFGAAEAAFEDPEETFEVDMLVDSAITGLRAGGQSVQIRMAQRLASGAAGLPGGWQQGLARGWCYVKQLLLCGCPTAICGGADGPAAAQPSAVRSEAYYDQLAGVMLPDAVVPHLPHRPLDVATARWSEAKQGLVQGWCVFKQLVGFQQLDCGSAGATSGTEASVAAAAAARPVAVSRRLLGRQEQLPLPAAATNTAAQQQGQQGQQPCHMEAELEDFDALDAAAAAPDELRGAGAEDYADAVLGDYDFLGAGYQPGYYYGDEEYYYWGDDYWGDDNWGGDYWDYLGEPLGEYDGSGEAGEGDAGSYAEQYGGPWWGPEEEEAAAEEDAGEFDAADAAAIAAMPDYDGDLGAADAAAIEAAVDAYLSSLGQGAAASGMPVTEADAMSTTGPLPCGAQQQQQQQQEQGQQGQEQEQQGQEPDFYADFDYLASMDDDMWANPADYLPAGDESHSSNEQPLQRSALPLPADFTPLDMQLLAVNNALLSFFSKLQDCSSGGPGGLRPLKPSDVSDAQLEALQQYARSWLELAGSWHGDVAASLRSYLEGQKQVAQRVEEVYRDVVSRLLVDGF